MRIALVAPPWAPIPPTLYGGIELVVDLLARGFVAAGHDVLLFATGDSTCPVPTQHVLEHAEGSRIGADIPELIHVLAAYDAVQEFGADIVHDHTMFGPLWAAHLPGLRAVTTIHGPLESELATLYRRMAAHTRLIAISHNQRRAAPDIPVARVIHHGIDASQFPLGPGGEYCLFLGRLDPDKGARRAIDAAKKAGVPLKLAGKMRNPVEREYFDHQVAPMLGEDVEYLGEVSHEEKVALLAGAKAVLFPIRWPEPFGMVMLEALACGTPVLAFPEGAAPEVIHDGETGFLCHDEADMAAELLRVDTLSREACRAAVEGYFSTERMVRDHLELFDDMLAGAAVTSASSIVFDHIALATEHWRDAWPGLAGDLGGRWVSGGQGAGYSPMQLRFANGMKIELLEPHDVERNDFLRRFLDRHGTGPHHLTFKVPDIDTMLTALDANGFPPINVDLSDPQWKEGFVHPHHVGVVVQAAQAQQEWDAPAPPDIPEPRGELASLELVALAVASIDAARVLFSTVLEGQEIGAGDDEAARWVDLAWRGPGRLRLLEPASAGSPLQQWLGDRSGRIHHIAFNCGDPAELPGALELSDGRWELPPDKATGTRILLSRPGD